MKLLMILLGLAGLALATALIVWQGVASVVAAVAGVGWGLLVVVAFDIVPTTADGLGWRCLLPRDARPSVPIMVGARWIRQSVNNLLPVAKIGGELVGARLLILRGLAAPVAGASVVVDLTLAVFTQALFTLMGLALLANRDGAGGVVGPVLGGTAILALGLAGFVVAQRRGLFAFLANRLERLMGEKALDVVGGARRLDAAIAALHRNRAALARDAAFLLGSWVLGTGEVWLALYFLGHPVGIGDAMIMQSLGQAVRSAAFAVPGAVGVQEGGYMVLAGLIGVPAETGLAVALIRRVREISSGVPALLVWQAIEGKRLFARRRAASGS